MVPPEKKPYQGRGILGGKVQYSNGSTDLGKGSRVSKRNLMTMLSETK